MADVYLHNPQLEGIDPAVFEEVLKTLRESVAVVDTARDAMSKDVESLRRHQARQKLEAPVAAMGNVILKQVPQAA